MLKSPFAALVAAASLAACSSGPNLAPAVHSSTYGPGAQRNIYPARHVLEVSGDITFNVEQEHTLDVYEATGPGIPVGGWLLTASVGQGAMAVGESTLLRWSADLVPGQYEGPGKYVIDGERAPEVAEMSKIRSAAYFSLVGPEAGDAGVVLYNVLNEPCTIEIETRASRGRVECPDLGLEGEPSRSISWTWTWERLEAGEGSGFQAPAPSAS